MTSMKNPLSGMISALLGVLLAVQPVPVKAERWVLVNTRALTVTVMDDQRPQITLHNLSIGRYGTSRTKRRGDNSTPLGRFRITRINRNATFHRFIGLSYPDAVRAELALGDGTISVEQFRAIRRAHQQSVAPPQTTPLGGFIGIHGLGGADPGVHQTMNWTKGCVALTNAQIDTLLLWVDVGMAVEIR